MTSTTIDLIARNEKENAMTKEKDFCSKKFKDLSKKERKHFMELSENTLVTATGKPVETLKSREVKKMAALMFKQARLKQRELRRLEKIRNNAH